MIVDYGCEKFLNMSSMTDRFSRLFTFQHRGTNKTRAQSQPDEKKICKEKPPIQRNAPDTQTSSNGQRSKSYHHLSEENNGVSLSTIASKAISPSIGTIDTCGTSGDEAMSVQKAKSESGHRKASKKDIIKSPISVLASCKGKVNLDLICRDEEYHLKINSARGLRDNKKMLANSIIYIYLVVDGERRLLNRSNLMANTEEPEFNLDFSWSKTLFPTSARILLMFYSQNDKSTPISDNPSQLDFLGCMSFGVKGFTTRKQINGWYYLLNEKTGAKKHLKAGLDPIQPLDPDDQTIFTAQDAHQQPQNIPQSPTNSAFSIFKPSLTNNNGSNGFPAGFYQSAPYIVKTKRQPSSLINAHFCRSNPDTQKSSIENSPTVEKSSGVARRFTNQLPPSHSMNALSADHSKHPNQSSPNISSVDLSERLKPAILAAQKFNLQLDPSINQCKKTFNPASNTSTPLMSANSRQSYQAPSYHSLNGLQTFGRNFSYDPRDYQCIKFTLYRCSKGFGFTLTGSCPVMICNIEPNSPAYYAGLQIGDYVIKIDQLNVSRSNTENVVRMLRMSPPSVFLTILRSTSNHLLSHPYNANAQVNRFGQDQDLILRRQMNQIYGQRQNNNFANSPLDYHQVQMINKNPPPVPARGSKLHLYNSENIEKLANNPASHGFIFVNSVKYSIVFKTVLEMSLNDQRFPVELVLTELNILIFIINQEGCSVLKEPPIALNKIYYVCNPDNLKNHLNIQYINDNGARMNLTLFGPAAYTCCSFIKKQLLTTNSNNISIQNLK